MDTFTVTFYSNGQGMKHFKHDLSRITSEGIDNEDKVNGSV